MTFLRTLLAYWRRWNEGDMSLIQSLNQSGITQSSNQVRRGPEFWDQIDAHSTDGIAEYAAELLNAGWSELSVADRLHVSLSSVEYIAVHEDYGVLPPIARRFIALRHQRFSAEVREAFGAIARVMKEAKRGKAM